MTYAADLLCLSAAKLMALDRMWVFAAPQGIGMRGWWAAAGRVAMAAVVLDNAVFTPEFQSTIVLMSSPPALLVALWGMASPHLMKWSGQEWA